MITKTVMHCDRACDCGLRDMHCDRAHVSADSRNRRGPPSLCLRHCSPPYPKTKSVTRWESSDKKSAL
eukprot:1615143-Pyramimonas_sp.AAC.1